MMATKLSHTSIPKPKSLRTSEISSLPAFLSV
ncbi:hypothetical protein B566_EDAN018241 [Ephemera danica]|nr:hypothetical protein B566_EDAN018241 [Ephemera danica]